MTYRITALRASRPGSSSRVTGRASTSIDDIRFERAGDATAIDYAADIQLGGLLRLVQPFLGGRFEQIGKDAAAGMARDPRGAGRRHRSRGRTLMRVAIIGAGISGLSAAYALHRDHDIALYDAESPVGGHVKTVDGRDRRRGRSRSTWASSSTTSVTYPTFLRMIGELGVQTQPSDMSLGSACRACDVEFSSRGARGCFAQPAAALRPGHWRLFADILRFYRDARARLDAGVASRLTLGRVPRRDALRRRIPRPLPRPDHVGRLVDAAGAIRDFRVDYLLRFLDHHGLIGVGRALQWRTITRRLDGLRRAAPRPARPRDAVRAGDPVVRRPARRCRRHGRGRPVARGTGSTPSSWRPTPTTPWRCSHDADPRERRALGGFEYTTNHVVLHTDDRLLPRRPAARGVVERRPGRLPAAGRRADDDVPHEPAAVAAGARPVLRVGQPGRPPGPGDRDRRGPRRCGTRATRSRRSTPRRP